MERVFIVSAARSAIGNFGGSLATCTPAELGRIVADEVLSRASNPNIKERVDEVIVGNVLGAGHGMNIARQVALGVGLSVSTPAYTVNKVCGSGLKSVTLGAASIASGEASVILAGGVESMSQAGFVSLSSRWGARLGHAELRDLILQDGLTDVFNSCHMGITAENLAEKYDISRADQDAFALESQRKAALAASEGRFDREIAAVPLFKKGKQIGEFCKDEYPRETTLEALSNLKPAFKKDGSVTAGNASGINDGAAFVLLASEKVVQEMGLTVLAEIDCWASAGVEPEFMGIGPVNAVKKLVDKSKVSLSSVD
ncbi:MAG: acetyl-CoA C-acyltransferase, partial [Bdellovibrionales bacterium]|nr:acetyl-CoA C-acyltransferase [Bdellovibrionales bacterium]